MVDYQPAANKVCDTWWERLVYKYEMLTRLNRKFPKEWRELIDGDGA